MEIQRGRNRTMIIIVTLFILAVVVAAGTLGYFWYRKANEPEPTSSAGGSISLEVEDKVETEKIEAALVIPSSTDKPGDTIKLSALSLTAPKSWRTINAKNLLNTPLENLYATSQNDILAQLIMVPEKQPADPTQAINSLSLYNITSWLSKPTIGTGGTVAPAVKAAYIQNIRNIGEGKAADKKACDKGFGVLNTAICADLLKPTAIVTADKSLKGVAFFSTTAPNAGYDPQVLVFLAGEAKDQQIFAYGAFHILDNNSHSLDAADTEAIKEAWEAFASGNIKSDTLRLYQHVVDAVESIVIRAN